MSSTNLHRHPGQLVQNRHQYLHLLTSAQPGQKHNWPSSTKIAGIKKLTHMSTK